LQNPLFFKSGRGIRLTPQGMLLKKKAALILQMEEDVRLELTGKEVGRLNVYISSEEILQSSYGIRLLRVIEQNYPQARVQFLIRSDQKAIEQVSDGEAHLALVTVEPPADVAAKVLAKVEFRTCASKEHPLFKKFSVRQTIPIEEVLKHSFVSPTSAILGKIAKASSMDQGQSDNSHFQLSIG
jgi:DNA-binding transcriptional LysR family regulator